MMDTVGNYILWYNLRQNLTSHFQFYRTGILITETIGNLVRSVLQPQTKVHGSANYVLCYDLRKVSESFWQVAQFDKLEENFCVWQKFHLISLCGIDLFLSVRSIPAHVQPTYLSWWSWCLKIMTCQVITLLFSLFEIWNYDIEFWILGKVKTRQKMRSILDGEGGSFIELT